MQEASATFPVRTERFTFTLGGVPCTAITSLYANRVVFMITQLETFGTVVQAQKETVLGGGTTFSTTTLLGLRDDPLPELCARQLIERLDAQGCDLPVLLFIGLNRKVRAGNQRDLLLEIVGQAMAHQVWRQTPTPPA